MNRNQNWKKHMAMIAAASVSVSGCGMCVMAADQDETNANRQYKDESVYVNTGADGSVEKITVSDWLKNEEAKEKIEDQSSLSNIQNVKGEETFAQNGEALVWDAAGEDIYYQGESQKELPVTMKITYTLDGREMTPEEMAGKSGHMEMKITYTNRTRQMVDVNGTQTEMCVPFLMLTGGIFPTEHFKNIEIDHGKVISDASRQIVAGAVLPGLTESLDLTDEDTLEIPESLTITADVTEFEMGSIFTVGSADAFAELGLSDADNLDELTDKVNELTDASLKLVDGSSTLADGVRTLKEKSSEFASGIDTLAAGASQVNTGAKTLYGGLQTYTSGTGQLVEGVAAYTEGASTLSDGIAAYVEGVGTIQQGANQKLPVLSENVRKLSEGITAFQNQAFGEKGLEAGAEQLAVGAKKIYEETKQLAPMMSAENLETLSKQMKLLGKGLTTAKEAITQAASGIENGAKAMQEAGAGMNTSGKQLTELSKVLTTASGAINQSVAEVNAKLQAAETDTQNQVNAALAKTEQEANEKLQAQTDEVNARAEKAAEEVKSQLLAAGTDEAVAEAAAATVRNEVSASAATVEVGSVSVDLPEVSVANPFAEGGQVAQALQGASASFTAGAAKLEAGGTALTERAKKLGKDSELIKGLTEGAAQMDAAAAKMEAMSQMLENAGDPAKQLVDGLKQLSQGANALKAGTGNAAEAVDTLTDNSVLLASKTEEGVNQLLGGFQTLQANDSQLLSGSSLLKMSGKDLIVGANKLKEGTPTLLTGALALTDGTSQLAAGTDTLKSGTSKLLSGIDELSEGADKLADGMKEFNEEGIEKISDVLTGDLENVFDRLKSLADLSENYESFSGISEDMSGEVKFIFETETVEVNK